MYAPAKTLNPDVLISLIGKEFDRQKMQCLHHYGGGRSKDDDKATDEAMAANTSSSKWKGKGGAKKPKGKCWNCGEKGHFKDKCPKPPKANMAKKEECSKEKASGSANAAAARDSESEGAWAAMGSGNETASSENGSMPGYPTLQMNVVKLGRPYLMMRIGFLKLGRMLVSLHQQKTLLQLSAM